MLHERWKIVTITTRKRRSYFRGIACWWPRQHTPPAFPHPSSPQKEIPKSVAQWRFNLWLALGLPYQSRAHWTVSLWAVSLVFKLVKDGENPCTNLQMSHRKTKVSEMDISNELSRWRSLQVIVHISWGLGFSWIHLSVIFHTYYRVSSLEFLMQHWTWSDQNGADKPRVCCTDNQTLWRWN